MHIQVRIIDDFKGKTPATVPYALRLAGYTRKQLAAMLESEERTHMCLYPFQFPRQLAAGWHFGIKIIYKE